MLPNVGFQLTWVNVGYLHLNQDSVTHHLIEGYPQTLHWVTQVL
jgi:hypothetical protein